MHVPKLRCRIQAGPAQRTLYNLKKTGVALRRVGRLIQRSCLDAISRPLQGYLERVSGGHCVVKPNTVFVQTVPKRSFNSVQPRRRVRCADNDSEQRLNNSDRSLRVVEKSSS